MVRSAGVTGCDGSGGRRRRHAGGGFIRAAHLPRRVLFTQRRHLVLQRTKARRQRVAAVRGRDGHVEHRQLARDHGARQLSHARRAVGQRAALTSLGGGDGRLHRRSGRGGARAVGEEARAQAAANNCGRRGERRGDRETHIERGARIGGFPHQQGKLAPQRIDVLALHVEKGERKSRRRGKEGNPIRT